MLGNAEIVVLMHLLMAMRTQLIYQKRRQKHRLSMAKLAIAALTIGSIANGLSVQIKSTPAEAFWQSEIAWDTTAGQAKAPRLYHARLLDGV